MVSKTMNTEKYINNNGTKGQKYNIVTYDNLLTCR